MRLRALLSLAGSTLHWDHQEPPRPRWKTPWCLLTCVDAALPPPLLQSIERDQRTKAQGLKNLDDFEPNDLNYEGRLLEDRFLFDGISFNLATDTGEDVGGFGPLVKLCGSAWFQDRGVSDLWCALSSVQKPG